MAAALKKIPQDNLMSRVYQEIKTALTAGRFKPGERLPIRKLAQQLGTSPTPVREALQKLVSYGNWYLMVRWRWHPRTPSLFPF
jgi:DNA-binding GntR family transcriptional regulator